jgi:hypothetical protein
MGKTRAACAGNGPLPAPSDQRGRPGIRGTIVLRAATPPYPREAVGGLGATAYFET